MNRHVRIAFWSYLAPMASARGLRIVLALSVAFLGAILAGRAAGIVTPETLAGIRAFVFVPGLPLFALLLAEMALRDGITHRTLLYPLLGPVPRTTMAVVRTLATGLLLFAILAGILLVLRLVGQLGWAGWPRELVAVFFGGLAYAAIFSLIHLLSKRGLIIGLAVFAVLDYPIGRLPFSLRGISPSYHLRVLADQIDTLSLPIEISLPDPSVIGSVLALAIFLAAGTSLTAFFFARKNLADLC